MSGGRDSDGSGRRPDPAEPVAPPAPVPSASEAATRTRAARRALAERHREAGRSRHRRQGQGLRTSRRRSRSSSTSPHLPTTKNGSSGCWLAPFAGTIGISIISAQMSRNPAIPQERTDQQELHEPLALPRAALVLLGLAVVMLVTAWFRKRLYLGIVMALYGLSVFNLHCWGFGIPFVMAGAWLLVRSYRAQRALREATGDVGSSRGERTRRRPPAAPSANKRYTPPHGATQASLATQARERAESGLSLRPAPRHEGGVENHAGGRSGLAPSAPFRWARMGSSGPVHALVTRA